MFSLNNLSSGDMGMIRFLVFSDLHYDEVADGDERIDNILRNARRRQLDFIVSLGDLCRPVAENRKLLNKFKSLGVPFYNVIGNHETDNSSVSEIMGFLSLSNPYYSVVHNGYKLIFLNTCYLNDNGEEKPYYRKNFKNIPSVHPIVPTDELQWLHDELSDGMKYIVFSHHSLVNEFAKRGVSNRAEVRELFKGKSVLLCLNGHDHGDGYSYVDGVSYITINSANYAWLGSQIASSDSLQKKYAYLHGMLQYKQAMSAYIEIDDDEIRICGENGNYLSVTPDDIELYDYRWNGVSIKPQISSYCIKLK